LQLRAFAVDVDGTITEDGGRLHLESVFILRWLQQLGHAVILVSGRGLWEMLALSIYTGCSRVVVCENGGVIADSPSHMTLLTEKNNSLVAYDHLVKKIPGVTLRDDWPTLTEVSVLRNFDIMKGKSLLDDARIPVTILDSGYAYHLTSKTVDKAKGLTLALKSYDIEIKDCVAIGDSDTDTPMFKSCGYSVAIGSAPETTRNTANFVVKSNMGEGFVEAVQHISDKFMKRSIKEKSA